MHIVTYKACTSAHIPVRQVLVKTGGLHEHGILYVSFGINVERSNACEFSLTAIPCEMKDN